MAVITNLIWRKYTNPWSVGIRFLILSMLVVSTWSRVWIGYWSLLLILLTLLWIWFNPRIFPDKKPNVWAMQAILGERIWLNRQDEFIPEHHFFIITGLQFIVFISFFICIGGAVFLSLWLTIFGLVLTCLMMCWFLDRMVWLYKDNKQQRENNRVRALQQQRKLKRKEQLAKATA